MSRLMHSYTYTVLRYVHDITSGEFVNVGVALLSPSARFIGAKTRPTFGRVTRVFPGANGEYFKRLMQHVTRRFELLSQQETALLPSSRKDVLELARDVFPRDDSSLQWSPIGSGKTAEPAKTLEDLFQRLVMRYDERRETSRDDQDVWGVFSKSLQERHVLERLGEKRIVGAVDEVRFAHAWKNGVWHCLEPLSFDLVEPESIKNKARRFVGQMQLVSDATEAFKVYLLLGEPSHAEAEPAFDAARKMLDRLPIEHRIFTEAQADELSALVATEIDEHDSAGGGLPS